MQRYFINQVLENDSEQIQITGENFHHITRVMRMKPNDQVYLVFSNKQTAIAEITSTSEKEVQLSLVEWLDETTELPIQMTIASGLPKGDKLEFIVQKSTELGAYAFVPFKAERSVVKWDEKK